MVHIEKEHQLDTFQDVIAKKELVSQDMAGDFDTVTGYAKPDIEEEEDKKVGGNGMWVKRSFILTLLAFCRILLRTLWKSRKCY